MSFRRVPWMVCALALAACGEPAKDGLPSGEGGRTGSGGASLSGGTANPGEGGRPQSGGAPTSGGAASGGATPGSGGAGQSGATTGGSSGASNTGGATAGGASTGGTSATGGGGATATGGNVSSTGGVGGSAASGGVAASGGASSGGAATSGGATSSGGRGGTGGGGGTAGAAGGPAGSGGSAGATGVYRPCPTNGSPCKIMPFGDSITDGYGIAGGYRVELFRLAHQAGKNITFVGTGSNSPGMVDGVTFPPNHEGHSGFTIAPAGGREGISSRVATVMPQFTPHIVTLMIGTNDANDNYEMAAAPTRLGALIDSIFAQLPNVLLVVAQPIPTQDDAINQRLQTYNAAIPAVVKVRADAGRHILLVNMYTAFTANAQPYKTALLNDTWHPNVAGHAILGARWYSALSPSL